jgi:hypothetical protein
MIYECTSLSSDHAWVPYGSLAQRSSSTKRIKMKTPMFWLLVAVSLVLLTSELDLMALYASVLGN